MDVLVVEDNPGDVDLIREMLAESESFSLSPVSRLAGAIDALEERAFEAVLLDLGLPDSQGLETLARLRSAVSHVPIVVSSGLSDTEVATQAVRLGAQDYVIKGSYDGDQLARTLRYAVARGRIESAIRESEAQYRHLFELHPHPMWVFDPTSLAFLAVNDAAARSYGWSQEEFLSMSVEALLPPEARGRFRASIDAVREAKPLMLGADLPWSHLTRSGERRDVELTLGPIPFRGVSALLAVATDVTEYRRLQHQLLRARKLEALGQLAGGVAHDFNNTLGVIMGYGELILGDEQASPSLRRHADTILQAARLSSDITRQLLAFGGRQELEPKSVDLNSLIADFGNMLQHMLGPNVHVVTNPGLGLGRVRADPVQLQQVLLNLSGNARDAMPEGGTLVIETSNVDIDAAYARTNSLAREGAFVELLVGDTGSGMDDRTLTRLYEPFYSTRGEDEHSGLGLATVYGIVQQSQGFIDVYSKLGEGTIFRVFLPRADGEPDPESQEPSGDEIPGGSETVLVVEGAEALREFLREILEDAGYEVLAAAGPEEALEIAAAREAPIGLVLTELAPPGTRGPDLVKRLASLRPETKVLYVSSYTRTLLGEHRAQAPGARLLVKPFTARELLSSTRAVLDGPKASPH